MAEIVQFTIAGSLLITKDRREDQGKKDEYISLAIANLMQVVRHSCTTAILIPEDIIFAKTELSAEAVNFDLFVSIPTADAYLAVLSDFQQVFQVDRNSHFFGYLSLYSSDSVETKILPIPTKPVS